VHGVAHLTHHAQAVGGVARQDLVVGRQGRAKLRHRQPCPQAQQVDALAQHLQRAALVQLLAQAAQQHLARAGAIMSGERGHASGCVCRTHASTSSGKSARARS
jgi:hypothetical protein